MATAILVYVPVAYLADRTTKKPFVLITFGFFTLFPLILWQARTFGPLYPVLYVGWMIGSSQKYVMNFGGEPRELFQVIVFLGLLAAGLPFAQFDGQQLAKERRRFQITRPIQKVSKRR